MHKTVIRAVTLICLLGCLPCGPAAADGQTAQWKQAAGPRAWQFPRDHGAHPAYKTEWWYFTGNLEDDQGRCYGYQLTFFRQGVRFHVNAAANEWSVRDVYFAHFAVTDVQEGRFTTAERISRAGPGLAGAGTQSLETWIFNWSATMRDNSVLLAALDEAIALELELCPRKPVVLHGDNGLSRKGAGTGRASYYSSFTDLKTGGRLKVGKNAGWIDVSGTSWYDHEFGSDQLSPEQIGWDWFSLHLSDGRDLMLYRLRTRTGGIDPASSGTLVGADGTGVHLSSTDSIVRVLDTWRSPKSGAEYPGKWQIIIPSFDIELVVAPLVADQELFDTDSTGLTYWEGASAGSGSAAGKTVTCRGYVELTGYAGGLDGVF